MLSLHIELPQRSSTSRAFHNPLCFFFFFFLLCSIGVVVRFPHNSCSPSVTQSWEQVGRRHQPALIPRNSREMSGDILLPAWVESAARMSEMGEFHSYWNNCSQDFRYFHQYFHQYFQYNHSILIMNSPCSVQRDRSPTRRGHTRPGRTHPQQLPRATLDSQVSGCV